MGIIPGVAVNLANGNIGGAANTSDGVVGQILTGAGTGTIALLQPCMFVSLADAINQGLTQAAEPEAYQFVADFYNDAPIGSVLYLMLSAATVSIQSLCDKTNANYATKLLNFAIGTAGGQIRVLGVARTPGGGYSPTTDEFIDSDAVLAGPNAQALVTQYFTAHTPVRVLIGARVADPASNVIFAPNTAGFNGVGYTIGGSETGEGRRRYGNHTGKSGRYGSTGKHRPCKRRPAEYQQLVYRRIAYLPTGRRRRMVRANKRADQLRLHYRNYLCR